MGDTQKTRSAQLSEALASAADLDAVKQVAATAIKVVAEQEDTIETATNENLALQDKLERIKSGESIKPEVTVGDKDYTVEHAVNYNGKIYKPEEIAENADLAKKLAESGSTALAEKLTD